MSNEILKGRLTAKKLVAWCNEQFKEFGINDYEVTKITRTRYNKDQYESGACKLLVSFITKSLPKNSLVHSGYFMCFYSISEYQYYINNGCSLYLKDKSRHGILSDFEIEIRNK